MVSPDSYGLVARCDYFSGDKGYDGTDYHTKLWDKYGIKCVIDICYKWKDGDKERAVSGCENVAYDYCGNVYCYCMKTGER
ncbi:MAG: hypothetical protein KJ970_03350 [Candidatus Eisenbacteria bacterium]|uniref:Uncharacterized protein n=1 Tax=Eiseniibacteriota bacterium TaxID=2212470 RepID=A0A948RVW7_UNCEI|nr:hypothetical protein [Candidatus Eisenbacteria bacterium]MBU1949512.1 hypothetical protein [Candidatus Eisenbacteria bacterium]MBU2689937.1 hypothetical protein [Candidatus Eisenbacteria bacterium]